MQIRLSDTTYRTVEHTVIWSCNSNERDEYGCLIYNDVSGMRYALKDGEAKVIMPHNINSTVVIPSKITYNNQLYNVTRIDDDAFHDCSSLTDITIPDSVTSIGDYAFSGCKGLTIYCEAEYTYWGSSWNVYYMNKYGSNGACPVIWNYKNNNKDAYGYEYAVIDGIRYSLKDGIAEVIGQPINIIKANIPASVIYENTTYSVTSIDVGAFQGCSSLTSVTIGNGVNTIGSYAFSGCTGLTSITIPDGVTSIDGAFFGCSGLTSITIPNSVTSIDGAFYGCSSLEKIEVGEGNTVYASQDGILYNKAKTKFIHIPEAIKGAVTIPDGVTSIGWDAFSGCSGLTSITLPDGVTSIGSRAFKYCSNLTSITIPNSVTSIANEVVDFCYKLTSVTYNGTKAQWKAISKGIYWNEYSGNYTITCTDGKLDKYENEI